mmetsp:Transcript_27688/g.63528  ORF Transcript_27688/g.63528 Transcript_27688/m.63528 type:complete len:221 (+) Transcript_27688:137-799(+)
MPFSVDATPLSLCFMLRNSRSLSVTNSNHCLLALLQKIFHTLPLSNCWLRRSTFTQAITMIFISMLMSAMLPFSAGPSCSLQPSISICSNCLKVFPLAFSSISLIFCHRGCSSGHRTRCMCFSLGFPHPSLHPPASPLLLRVGRSPCISLNLVMKSTGVANPIEKFFHTSLNLMFAFGPSWNSTGHLVFFSHVGLLVLNLTASSVNFFTDSCRSGVLATS